MGKTNANFIEIQVTCWSCSHKISSIDRFCKHCGKGQGNNISWLYKPSGILFLAVTAGPLALGTLWRSPQLSKRSKWFATFFILILSYFLLQSIYKTMDAMLPMYSSLIDASIN